MMGSRHVEKNINSKENTIRSSVQEGRGKGEVSNPSGFRFKRWKAAARGCGKLENSAHASTVPCPKGTRLGGSSQ